MSQPMKEGIFELALSGRKSAALLLAIGAGLLDAIGGHPLPRVELAEQCGIHPSAARILLGLLCCLGLVEESVDGLRLHPEMNAALSGPWGAMVRLQAQMFFGTSEGREWLEAARGERFADPTGWTSNTPALALYPEAMRRAGADIAFRTLRKARPLPACGAVLDVGGGTGTFGAALLRTFPGVRWAVVDLPAMEPAARSVARGEGAEDRFSFFCHDVRHGLPEDRSLYDLIILSQILHLIGEEARERLLAESIARLSPGGKLAIVDFFPGGSDAALIPWLMAMDWIRYGTMFCESVEETAALLEGQGLTTAAFSLGPVGSTLLLGKKGS